MKPVLFAFLLLSPTAIQTRFDDALHRACPDKHLERLTPGSLDLGLENYTDSLAPQAKAALTRRMQVARLTQCTHTVAGLGCSNLAALDILHPAEMTAFTRQLCQAPVVCREDKACNLPGS